jgi:TetR/AcrR family transcriptional regulator, cholesterol catabolism regulator
LEPHSLTQPDHSTDRRVRRRLDVRDRIKCAAMELFREKGYEATTVEEIAERADVARGTFFNHFARKDALLVALGEDLLEEVEEQLGPLDQWMGNAREQMLRYFFELGRRAERDGELFKTIVVEQTRQYWLCDADDIDIAHQRFRETIRTVIARGRERGEVADDIDDSAAARLLEGLHIVTLIEWIRARGSEDELRAQLAPALDIIFRGLQTGQLRARGIHG